MLKPGEHRVLSRSDYGQYECPPPPPSLPPPPPPSHNLARPSPPPHHPPPGQQIADAIHNGFSGQPTIPRDQFTRKLADFYYDVFEERRHVLVVYDKCAKLLSLKRVEGPYGVIDGPTEMITVHKKCTDCCGFRRWGYDVWVFGEGVFELLGDGGYINWAFRSPSYKRDGKKVVFHKIDGDDEGKGAEEKPILSPALPASDGDKNMSGTATPYSLEEEELLFEYLGEEDYKSI